MPGKKGRAQLRTYHMEGGYFITPGGGEIEPPKPDSASGEHRCFIAPYAGAPALAYDGEDTLRTVIGEHLAHIGLPPSRAAEEGERLFSYYWDDEEPGETDFEWRARRAAEWREKRRAAWSGGFLGSDAELAPLSRVTTKAARERIADGDIRGRIAAARRAEQDAEWREVHDYLLAEEVKEWIEAGRITRL